MPIQLPTLSPDFAHIIPRKQPGNPPTEADVASGIRLAYNCSSRIDDSDVVKAAEYAAQLMATRPNVTRAFNPDLHALRESMQEIVQTMRNLQTSMEGLRRDVNEIRGDVNEMKRDINEIQVDVKKTRRTIAILANEQANRIAGASTEFEIVLFPDGSDPTDQMHNLPPLTSVAVVKRLSRESLTTYYTHYRGVANAGRVSTQARIDFVLTAIGARPETP